MELERKRVEKWENGKIEKIEKNRKAEKQKRKKRRDLSVKYRLRRWVTTLATAHFENEALFLKVTTVHYRTNLFSIGTTMKRKKYGQYLAIIESLFDIQFHFNDGWVTTVSE